MLGLATIKKIFRNLGFTQQEEPKTSTHKAEVVEIKLQKHPNADSLSIVEIYGFTVCVNTEIWKDKKYGIYIQPDTLVKTTRQEFDFLKKEGRDQERIKVIKLRGVISMGLLVPCPDPNPQVGDDYWERLELERYNRPIKGEPRPNMPRGYSSKPPECRTVKYDLDNFRRYARLFEENEPVIISEKLDGASARYVYSDGEFFIGSRQNWVKHDNHNIWSIIANKHSGIQNLCQTYPNYVLHGEVYGYVQSLRYGSSDKEYFFAAFDIFNGIKFLDFEEAYNLCQLFEIPWVPIIEKCPFSHEKVLTLAEGRSTIEGADHIREGVVVRPLIERYDRRIGRVSLKCVSNAYLMKEFE